MSAMDIFGWVLFGLLLGLVPKLLRPGHTPQHIFATAMIGMLGAIVGGSIMHAVLVGNYAHSRGAGWIGAVGGSVLLLLFYRMYNSYHEQHA
jgi:uncharacterized membrane protein YeaQ/YmgE (transglycosylase-associated protein family)